MIGLEFNTKIILMDGKEVILIKTLAANTDLSAAAMMTYRGKFFGFPRTEWIRGRPEVTYERVDPPVDIEELKGA